MITLENLIFALTLFAMRVLNNSISTINVIAITRQQKLLAAAMSFLEALIWVVVIANVINDLGQWLYLIAYAGGFAGGNLVGMMIESRLLTSYVTATITCQNKGHDIAVALREAGYGVTETKGQGYNGWVTLIHSTVMRRYLPDVLAVVHGVNPEAFVSVDEVRTVRHGWLGRPRKVESKKRKGKSKF